VRDPHTPAVISRRRWLWPLASLGLALSLLAGLLAAPGEASRSRGTVVKVMTRNLYLGANLRPAIDIQSFQGLVNFAGDALDQVHANNFPVRSRGLAQEIISSKVDLVALQEVSRWADAPCQGNPIPPSATNPQVDYLSQLMSRLNAGKRRYRVVIAQPEFDFQIWANTDGDESTSGPGCPFGSEIQARLTYSDVVLARLGAGVRTRRARRDNFDLLLQPQVSGVEITVNRGWARVEASVRGSRWFRFFATHLEAYDDTGSNRTNRGTFVGKGEIREAQANELARVARGRLPVVVAGDINSDDNTVQGADRKAYRALLRAGFVARSTGNPPSCCLQGDVLASGGGGQLSDFDHHIDHVLTDSPRKVTLVRSFVTGLRPVNGYWSADHAGVVSVLRILR
jgi:endonuclease/exonuclease/phosphatase family metal-dependent hydrolase